MNSKDSRPEDAAELRRRAEEITRERAARSPENIETLSPEETRRILHELRVHQIELEMQNEELHRAQVKLDAAWAHYFDFYDLAPVGYVTISGAGLILDANLTVATLLGVARGALVKQPISRFILKEDQDTYYLHRKQIFETGEPKTCELRMVRRDGTSFWAHLAASAARDEGGAPVSRIVIIDITERKRAEEALLESVARFKALFNATSDSVMLIRPDGTILDLNQTAADRRDLDTGTMLGKNIFDFLPAEGAFLRRGAIAQILNERRFFQCNRRRLFQYEELRDGKYYSIRLFPVVDERGKVFQLASFSRDITEREQMEHKLQRAQRMEAIGTLAGGIAHDFNNILFPIMGLSEMLLEKMPEDSPDKENIGAIHTAAKRARDLVKQILFFSRQAGHEKILLRVQQILKEVLKLTRSTIPSNIELTQSIQSDCGPVMADPSQVHQIAMNLITNAYHAVEAVGGSISIELKESVLTGEDWAGTTLEPGRYAVITVSDTGHGIDPALIGKIFEPYFTTKGVGKGTGLGLSVVHGIVKDHGGDIRVTSEVGKGAAFSVYLPVFKTATHAVSHENVVICETGTERILLVDDEAVIVRLEQMMLEKLGYQVTTRTSSIEALAAFKANPDAFDLVITDMTMPNMTGDKFAAELRSVKPGIPVVLCTGFSSKIDEKRAGEMGINEFLMKPVVKSEMARAVRKALDQAKG